jgi:hypothetical protein
MFTVRFILRLSLSENYTADENIGLMANITLKINRALAFRCKALFQLDICSQ